MRRLIIVASIVLVTACATTHGPQTITLSTAEIEQQIQTDLGGVMELFKGVDLHRPEVSLMPASERLQLEWNVKLPDGPTGAPLGVAVELSGKPALNAARNGIDLTQVRIEDVRLAGLPRFLSLARLGDKKGMTLPDLPLMALPADRLRQDQVAYGATGVGVGYTGLKIDIAPR
jgi:hypothetical protein